MNINNIDSRISELHRGSSIEVLSSEFKLPSRRNLRIEETGKRSSAEGFLSDSNTSLQGIFNYLFDTNEGEDRMSA